MKEKLILMLIQMFMQVLNPDLIKQLVDKILDFAEDSVLGSESTVDDKIVLPICAMFREALNVPDND